MELGELGLEEMLDDGVAVIEWADRAEGVLPKGRWDVGIEITGRQTRRFTVRKIE